MKKKIAIYANGWGSEYLQEIVHGVQAEAKQANADVFTFVEFSNHDDNIGGNVGEINIYRLVEMEKFDGVIILANSFNDPRVMEYLTGEIERTGVSSVCLEYEAEGIPTIRTDNYYGMYELAEHMIAEHAAVNVLVIAGPSDHQESNERVRAVMDAYRNYGMPIPKENILHGDWAKRSAQKCLNSWVKKNGMLPEAVICANDIMALGVCEELNSQGIRVPEQVRVTGYDYLMVGRNSYPSVSSVSHEWKKMGREAFSCLEQQWNGKKPVKDLLLKSKFCPAESCGCKPDRDEAKTIAERRMVAHQMKLDSIGNDSHFRHIYTALRKADDAESVKYNLGELFLKDHWMEGSNLMICVDPEVFRIEEADSNLLQYGYREEYMVACCLQENHLCELPTLYRSDAVFYYSDRKDEPELYFLVPLSVENRCLGFAVMNSDKNLIEDNYLYIWTRHMNQDFEQVRRNIKIADLTEKLRISSFTDKLTGVFNRSGCEERSYPMLSRLHAEGREGVVMIVDIDRMKRINDYYGHVYGDLSLKIVASVLKEEAPEDWIISRFGGDEFLVAGERHKVNLEELTERIYQRVQREKRQRSLEFPLSLSIGSIVVDTKTSFDIREIIQRADKMMYIVKKRHHRTLDSL